MVFMYYLSVCKSPDILVEASIFLLYAHENLGIVDGSLNLELVSDDSCVLSQGFQLLLIVCGDESVVESIESLSESIPLVQDALPVSCPRKS